MTGTSSSRDDLPPRSDLIAKLSVLEKWVKTEIPWALDMQGNCERDQLGERLLDFFPTRANHFASWDGTQNCEATRLAYPELYSLKKTRRRTAPESHPDLHTRLDKVLEALRAKSKAQLEAGNKSSQIDDLTRSVDHWRSLAHKQEGEIVALRERMYGTERELREAQAVIKNNKVESNRVVAERDAKIANLAELLTKIKPLR